MSLPLNPNIAATFPPPVMEARRWIAGVAFPVDRPLINVSQAAPVAPPPEGLRQALADAVLNNSASHLYGPVLGMPDLRAEVAAEWSRTYDGTVSAENVAITSGCNQAFTATLTTLAAAGDEVLLPVPWYFNHKMHLDMAGVRAVPLATGNDLLPDPELARSLITQRTRAIVLVTPNNPGGVEYPADLVQAFYDLAKAHGIALVLDETYRDFDSRTGAPHRLYDDPDWGETLVNLYSFSKAYRLTGRRVGAGITSRLRLGEVEKYLDTVTICPNQLGQIGALWGMRNLRQWLAGERAEILARRAVIERGFPVLDGWKLKGVGAYFAYVEHPFDLPSDAVAKALVDKASVLLLPGTMFRPGDDVAGQRELRIAYANADRDGIAQLFERLSSFVP